MVGADRARQRHGRPYGRRGDVLAAARSLAAELSLEAAWVEAMLAKAHDDGRIDLTRSSADAVGSAANLLAEHGWRRGMPTHYPVEPPVDTIERARLLVPDIVPSFTAAQMVERGALLDPAAMRHEGPLALVELLNGDGGPRYVAGTQNFYVLTRYNASSYYALAVVEFGRAITAAR